MRPLGFRWPPLFSARVLFLLLLSALSRADDSSSALQGPGQSCRIRGGLPAFLPAFPWFSFPEASKVRRDSFRYVAGAYSSEGYSKRQLLNLNDIQVHLARCTD